MQLVVDKTWDGHPIGTAEVATLGLSLEGDTLVVTVAAPFHGDPLPNHAVGATPGLWNHEVVELFIAGPGDRYLEIELGPHGHFLVLHLNGIRQVVSQPNDLDFRAEIHGATWSGRANVPMSWLPTSPLRVNAYAIHGMAEGRRYLCWSPVPGPKPDFHRLDCFRPCPELDSLLSVDA